MVNYKTAKLLGYSHVLVSNGEFVHACLCTSAWSVPNRKTSAIWISRFSLSLDASVFLLTFLSYTIRRSTTFLFLLERRSPFCKQCWRHFQKDNIWASWPQLRLQQPSQCAHRVGFAAILRSGSGFWWSKWRAACRRPCPWLELRGAPSAKGSPRQSCKHHRSFQPRIRNFHVGCDV